MGNIRISVPMNKIQAFCRKWKVSEFSIFGSALREDFGPHSDVDVLVEFEPGTRVGLDFFNMERELSEIFSQKVDLVQKSAVRNPFRRSHILENREIIHAA